jgi:nanoRNase/pAp phosphatase (c-di-AMP/oligoRNAs hydrolase)
VPQSSKPITPTQADLDRLKKVVEKRGKRWSILVAQVDPDGLATAYLVAAILRHLGAESTIYYAGGFGHPQNRFLKIHFKLDLELKLMSELPDEGPIALADSSRLEDSRFGRKIAAERFALIVDHHDENPGVCEDCFSYIRACGAASTLGWLLAKGLGAEVDTTAVQLTTIGIFSDTDKLTLAVVTAEDREAFVEAMRGTTQDLIHRCFNYDLPKRYLEVVEALHATDEVIESVRIMHAPLLLADEEGDWLSIIADDLKRIEDAKTVIVWGITGKEVRASVRTRSETLGMSDICKAVFGNGGGKHGAGGARYALTEPHVPFEETAEALIHFLDIQFKARLRLFLRSKEKKPKQNGKTPT